MVARYLWNACLLTALFLLVAPGGAAEPSNAEDGGSPHWIENWPPCDIVVIDTEPPYVDPHPECIGP